MPYYEDRLLRKRNMCNYRVGEIDHFFNSVLVASLGEEKMNE